ncbi:MAG: hypothetical protein LBH46_03500 [Rickettsiales bacterium]|jgi:transcriptional repressor NrdR|nr:hypothetical protein [Rickettsiales bacterium]
MKCLFCGSEDTNVVDSRDSDDKMTVKRRRVCPLCDNKFSTIEIVIEKEVVVLKRDGKSDYYNEDKLFNSISVSSGKRLTDAQVREIVENVTGKIRNSNIQQIDSNQIAEMVLDDLERYDKITYFRFAAVYWDFDTLEDVDEFLKKLKPQIKESF